MTSAPVSRLFVLRHAHSSWALPGQRDHQRPLDERGRADAASLAAEIGRLDLRIDRILCSTATRARQTLEGVRPGLGKDIPEELTDDLYALGVEAYLASTRARGAAGALLLIGHNPMVEEFVAGMAPEGEPDALAVLRAGFPTAGLAVIDMPVALSEAAYGLGRLAALVHPKGLADG